MTPARILVLLFLFPAWLIACSLSSCPAQTQETISCLFLDLEAPISPAQEELLKNALNEAKTLDADLLLIRLNTPGGLGSSMRNMVTTMLNAPLPVAVWVGPAGARAASAGVFLVAAAAVAGMAPQTSIGAATPVGLSGKDVSGTMAEKVQNDIISLLRGMVTARNRNMEWYEKAVTESASITAEEAVEQRVVEFLAPSREDFLDQMGIRGIPLRGGTLHFKKSQVEIIPYEPGLKYRLLAWILNPTIAYFLFLGGIAGLFFELSSPGAIFPGVFGALCLVLGMYALSILPTTPAGILLILLGLILFVVELKVVSYGLLSLAGVISLFLGSLILFDFEYGCTALPLRMILACVGGICVLFLAILFLVARAQTRPRAMGLEALMNQPAHILEWEGSRGRIEVHGEQWNARTAENTDFSPGDRVRITRAEGLMLDIAKES